VIVQAVCAIAAGYQLLALFACLQARRRKPSPGNQPFPASILKPVYGADPALQEAIASHLAQDLSGAGQFELLCGVRAGDPAVNLLSRFPGVRIVQTTTQTPNGKAGALIDLERAATHPLLVVNDADIRVEPDYLRRVTAPLNDPGVGLVTCLYRPEGDTFAARFEGLGVSTDFAPSALVARMVGVDEFAMGSTLAFRRADLKRIGGFEAIAAYLADDYQLGHRIHALGLKCVLSDVIVSTRLSGGWSDIWRHQIRWARTIRVSKFAGYLGLPVTFATLWAVVAGLSGEYRTAIALLIVRMIMAIEAGWFVLRSRDVLRLFYLIPLRDLFAGVVWLVGLFGSSVEWRGKCLKLDGQGKIVP
jgi:ceramide glucosyltransferase